MYNLLMYDVILYFKKITENTILKLSRHFLTFSETCFKIFKFA